MTPSFKVTSITGWTDWYTCSNFVPLSSVRLLLLSVFWAFSLLTWFRSTLQVAVLLHVGGSGEDLYLLCHLLCCPAGVGKWAAHFLQVSWLYSPSFTVVMSVIVYTELFFSHALRSTFGGTRVECSTLCKPSPSSCLLPGEYRSWFSAHLSWHRL